MTLTEIIDQALPFFNSYLEIYLIGNSYNTLNGGDRIILNLSVSAGNLILPAKFNYNGTIIDIQINYI